MKTELFKFGGTATKKEELVTGIVGAIILLFLWWLVTAAGIVSPKILPNPIDMLASIGPLFTESDLIPNIGYTIGLNLLGYLYALLIAIPLGFCIGIYPWLRCFFQKIIEAMRFIPMPVTTGLFIAAFGLSFNMKSWFLAVCILIYILPAVAEAVINLQNPLNAKDNVYLQTAKTIGMNNWQMFRYVYWPYVMQHIYGNIRSLTAISYSYVTIAESLNKVGGVGAMISVFSRQSRIPEVYALLFTIIIIGVIQDFIMKKLEPKFFPYIKQ